MPLGRGQGERNWLIASQAVALLGLLVPGLLSALIQDLPGTSMGLWLRILISGAASILALIGWGKYQRSAGRAEPGRLA